MTSFMQRCLFGTLIGDAHGSPYEGRRVSGTKIGSYTDDTEQAYGIAQWLKSGRLDLENWSCPDYAPYTDCRIMPTTWALGLSVAGKERLFRFGLAA